MYCKYFIITFTAVLSGLALAVQVALALALALVPRANALVFNSNDQVFFPLLHFNDLVVLILDCDWNVLSFS
jgi:hypothetical protein